MKTLKEIKPKFGFAIVLCVVGLFFSSCNNNSISENKREKNTVENKDALNKANEAALLEVMQKHLNAVTNRDLEALKQTMSPNGEMQLILPGSEIIDGVDGFMKYHKDWFAEPDWTFETKILNTEAGENLGMAITEIVYREPNRKPEPYFNRMIVSYDLKKIDGNWYIIKDHASSIEKSTDAK
ncbi:MAG: nuclear transport factor 2 family protein [Aequorivita sp.]|nr:nuclear transport factor 2 family protein [Aequorivita sp.]